MALTIPDLSGVEYNYLYPTFYVDGEAQDGSPYVPLAAIEGWTDTTLENFLNAIAEAWHIAYPTSEISYTILYGIQGQLTTEPTIVYSGV